MRVPNPPRVEAIRQLSPSLYEALLRCRARAAWVAHGDRSQVPSIPKALLGTCLHSVVEEANRGGLSGLPSEAAMTRAREVFDTSARTQHERSHPLLRAKFSAPEKLPYYNLYRERAALEAVACSARMSAGLERRPSAEASAASLAERRLESRDQLIVGRIDFIDESAGEIVDYKTGAGPQDKSLDISEAESRQLRLYIHLAAENGVRISRGVIARADGRRAAIAVSEHEAAAEGQQARQHLAEYNARAGEQFDVAAQPSAQNCQFCPCIPFCEAFWRASAAEWAGDCGTHVEGRVTNVETSTVQGMRLVTLRIDGQRGTLPPGEAFVEQVPEAWMTADGSDRPSQGDLVRVILGRSATDSTPHVVRVDRVSTSIWTVS